MSQNRFQLIEDLDIQLEKTCKLVKKFWTRVLSESASVEEMKRRAEQLVSQEEILDKEFSQKGVTELPLSLLKYYKLKELLFHRKEFTRKKLKAIVDRLKSEVNLNSKLLNVTVDTEIEEIETPIMVSSDLTVSSGSKRTS